MKLLKILSLVCLSISIGACAEHSMSRAKTSTIPQVNNSIIDQNVQALLMKSQLMLCLLHMMVKILKNMARI